MPIVSAIGSGFGGFLVGLIWLVFFGRVIRLLVSALRKGTVRAAPVVANRGRRAIPSLVVNPAPWLLLVIMWLTYAASSGRISSTWGWFVCGFLLAVLLNWSMVFAAVYRAKKQNSRQH